MKPCTIEPQPRPRQEVATPAQAAAGQGVDLDAKNSCVFRSTVGRHEAKRPYGKLKRIDATRGPRRYTRRYTDEPTNCRVEPGLLRLGDNVSNQWR